jgi:hypothetical protein
MSGSMMYANGGDVDDEEDEKDDKEDGSPLDLSDEDKSAVSSYVDPQGPSRDRQAQLDALQRLREKPMATPEDFATFAPGIVGAEDALAESAAPFVQEAAEKAIPAAKEAIEQAAPEIKEALPTLAAKLQSLLENPNQTVELQGGGSNPNIAKWLKLKEMLGLKGTTVIPK